MMRDPGRAVWSLPRQMTYTLRMIAAPEAPRKVVWRREGKR